MGSGEVDALRFEELVRVGRRAADQPEVALGAFDEALGLWRGWPYAEFASEEFAAAEVARLVELRAGAIEERSAALLELCRPEEVIGELEAEIAAEPFRERLQALLMMALARAGRPVEALRAFDAFRQLLADEVGVVPSPSLQSLNDDILRQHPDLGWARPAGAGGPVADLPTGTVTFLFTDLEGSTRLWEQYREAMPGALARHDEIVRSAIAAHGGQIVKSTGDGFHAVFVDAARAVEAAIEAQQALGNEAWSAPGGLRVRMGIHTGAAEFRGGDYPGTAVNRAARLMDLAHGGQVVCSHATADLAGDLVAEGVAFLDLGKHRLRDLSRAERVFQAVAPGLATEFPLLRSLDTLPGNLPLQLTSFVGRADELAAVARVLAESRLVTLTGVGGVGKTRLAMQVAAELLPQFADGAWLCELAAAADGVLMAHTVADAIGARQRDGRSMADSVVEFLRDRELLLVFDNCEHLLGDAAELTSAILRQCPRVRVLATSREALDVMGEQVVRLGSLPIPPVVAKLSVVTSSEAVRLFVDRATSARSGFTLGGANLDAVAEICRRLDGIPLAIELAAARVAAMTPADISAHLDERFRLLTGGRRSRVERHQTLRATLEWSYGLLDATERAVFDRLGVFVGSFDADAAEAVVGDDELEHWDVLDALTGLVRKSMIVADAADDGTTR